MRSASTRTAARCTELGLRHLLPEQTQARLQQGSGPLLRPSLSKEHTQDRTPGQQEELRASFIRIQVQGLQ